MGLQRAANTDVSSACKYMKKKRKKKQMGGGGEKIKHVLSVTEIISITHSWISHHSRQSWRFTHDFNAMQNLAAKTTYIHIIRRTTMIKKNIMYIHVYQLVHFFFTKQFLTVANQQPLSTTKEPLLMAESVNKSQHSSNTKVICLVMV